MNLGGCYVFFFGLVKFVLVLYSFGYEIDGVMIYMGEVSGIILEVEDKKIYYVGDMVLFLDMCFFVKDKFIDVVFLLIGDNYMMGLEDVLEVVFYLNFEIIILIYYNIFFVI